jgi:hypothetical protein
MPLYWPKHHIEPHERHRRCLGKIQCLCKGKKRGGRVQERKEKRTEKKSVNICFFQMYPQLLFNYLPLTDVHGQTIPP